MGLPNSNIICLFSTMNEDPFNWPVRSHVARMRDADARKAIARTDYFVAHIYNKLLIGASLGANRFGTIPWNKTLTTDEEKRAAIFQVARFVNNLTFRRIDADIIRASNNSSHELRALDEDEYNLHNHLRGEKGASDILIDIIAVTMIDETTTKKEILEKFAAYFDLGKYYRKDEFDSLGIPTEQEPPLAQRQNILGLES